MTAIQPEHSPMMLSDKWKQNAACIGVETEEFYSKKIAIARMFCDKCPVRVDCLEYALLTDQSFGIWGGMSESQRKKKYPPYIVKAMREDYDY